MRPSPLLSAAAVAALIAAVAGPASAATAAKPAQGLATSGVTLLGLAAGGHTLSTGTLALLSDTLKATPLAQVVLTPLTVDGTAYGRQVVRPSSGSTSSPALDSTSVAPSLLSGLLAVRAPVLTAAASNPDGGASTEAGSSSLGGASLLGLPMTVDGALDVTSVVTKAGSVGEQTVSVEDLALPSIADLLAALGLDVVKLPTEVLVELLDELDLLTTVVTTADQALTAATAGIQTQIDAAQAEVDRATTALAAQVAELVGPTSQLAAAERDLQTKTAALQPLRDAVTAAQAQLVVANAPVTQATAALDAALSLLSLPAGTPLSGVPPLNQLGLAPLYLAVDTAVAAAQSAITSATSTLTTATTALASAQSLADVAAATVTALRSTLATLQSAVDSLQQVLDAAVAALTSVLRDVQPLVDSLLASVVAVLDGTPLVSLDALSVVSRATATSAEPGDQTATVTGGEVAGLRVLGTDVLSNVLGTTRVDLLDMTSGQLGAVNALVTQLTGTLSSVLSTVPGFPTLSVPAPKVELLTKAVRTGELDGFGTAGTDLRALAITLPSISVPSALALPGAASLPALGGITQVAGLLTSAPITLELANLGNAVRFSPAVAAAGTPTTGTPTTGTPTTGTPGTVAVPTAVGTPQLPRTGSDQPLAALGLALLAGAFVARRRRSLGEA
ncbi:MAG: hypothetical protein JWN08_2125 [Frankiales bacterium]|nr:hypothetical protein [Frankiales bacterium]